MERSQLPWSYKTMKEDPFIRFPDQNRTFQQLAKEIRLLHPECCGLHIFEQLKALKLYDSFQMAETPHSLPYSFSDYDEVRKC